MSHQPKRTVHIATGVTSGEARISAQSPVRSARRRRARGRAHGVKVMSTCVTGFHFRVMHGKVAHLFLRAGTRGRPLPVPQPC